MKLMKIIVSLLLVFTAVAREAQPESPYKLKLTPAFGKTHFILDAPTKLLLEKSPISIMQLPTHKGESRVLFSPDDDVAGALIDYINNEQKSIKVAIFSFTNGTISQALIEAHNRGIHIEIVVDTAYGRDKFSKIERLKEAGVAVYCYNPRNNKTLLSDIMHNKFIVFELNKDNHSLVWTGSFNFTKSAAVNNQENVVIIDDWQVVNKYEQQFERLKKRSSRHYCPRGRKNQQDKLVQRKNGKKLLLAQTRKS